ncbi:hypothetical protein AALP_AA6G090300 [Arabis alpina]|uniref:Uncharacterized protein n=1 Tax=Arabis alpina TaxID=50452 RepID=A0A087GN15_ARAAL|nr:hypothetical protein AALP_AA6G090300 [Arabis alpina]
MFVLGSSSARPGGEVARSWVRGSCMVGSIWLWLATFADTSHRDLLLWTCCNIDRN